MAGQPLYLVVLVLVCRCGIDAVEQQTVDVLHEEYSKAENIKISIRHKTNNYMT